MAEKSIFKKQGIFGGSDATSNVPSQIETVLEHVIQPTQKVEIPTSTDVNTPVNTQENYDITQNAVDVVKLMQKGLRPIGDIKKSIPTSDVLKKLLADENLNSINDEIFNVSTIINEIKKILQFKEMELDVTECYLGLQIRTNPTVYGLVEGKTTEGSIKSVINTDTTILMLRKTIININYMYNGLFNILKVLQTKMKILDKNM